MRQHRNILWLPQSCQVSFGSVSSDYRGTFRIEPNRIDLPERRKMMQAWADYLDGLKAGAEVIPLFKKA
jgi:hypothetical protein